MKRFLGLLLAACLCMTAWAQTKTAATRVLYEDDTWLAQNGHDVWLVRLDLEWPRVLNDCVMPALHPYLAKHLLGVDAATPVEALRLLKQKTGTAIQQMPDGDGLTRHYLNAHLRMTSHEAGRYVSLFLKASETDSNGRAVRSERQWFTYDIVNDRILTADDVFHASNMAGTYDDTNRMLFENLIAENAQCSEQEMASIDLRTLPKDFAVEGSLMRFGLGGRSDNSSVVMMQHMEQLSLLNRKFLKWYKGEAKQKTAPVSVDEQPQALKEFAGEDSVYTLVDSMPQYAEGRDSLFRYITHHIQIPAEYAENGLQGRVIVSFVVEKDGTLSNFAIVRPVDRSLDRAAVAVIRSAGRWKPGIKDGQPVRTHFFIPVSIRLQ